jgi:hypothetical protein
MVLRKVLAGKFLIWLAYVNPVQKEDCRASPHFSRLLLLLHFPNSRNERRAPRIHFQDILQDSGSGCIHEKSLHLINIAFLSLFQQPSVDDTMTAGDGSRLAASAQWSDVGEAPNTGLYLKEFVYKHKLPRLVRIVKGHYLHLGAGPSLSCPTGGGQVVLLVNLGKRKRMLAQCVKFKDSNRKVSSIGQKISIPANYDGFFEILSEDGRSVREKRVEFDKTGLIYNSRTLEI